jgi:hypothetical protein
MDSERVAAEQQDSSRRGQKLFSVASANRALVFVRRVVQDLVQDYAALMALREQTAATSGAVPSEERSAATSLRIELLIERLSILEDELDEVGCELKDWSLGLVDFPALYQGRQVCLCWRMGEDDIRFWHEHDAGFRGRQPITAEFEAEIDAARKADRAATA